MVPQRDRDPQAKWMNPNNGLFLFLLAQALFALVWAVRADSGLSELKRSQMEQDMRINVIDARTHRIDVIEDRQQRASQVLDSIDIRLDRLEMGRR